MLPALAASRAAIRRNAPALRALRSLSSMPAPAPVGTPMNASLEESDPELFEVMEQEKRRQVLVLPYL